MTQMHQQFTLLHEGSPRDVMDFTGRQKALQTLSKSVHQQTIALVYRQPGCSLYTSGDYAAVRVGSLVA